MPTLVERVESLEAEIEHLKSLLENGGSFSKGNAQESVSSRPRTFTKRYEQRVPEATVNKPKNLLEGASMLLDEVGLDISMDRV